MHRAATGAGLGGVGAALLGTLCCIGAPLFLALGIGSGLIGAVAPFRPIFGVLMVGFLALGFYLVYGRGRAAGTESGTTSSLTAPQASRRDRVFLWAAAATAVLLWSLPILLEVFAAVGEHH